MLEANLKDEARMSAYREAIVGHPELFVNRRVLDLSRSHGLYSIFALQAGAKKCFVITKKRYHVSVKNLAAENEYLRDVQVISHISELDTNVDVIINEWADHQPLVNLRLLEMLEVRDKYLARGGIIVPDDYELYLGGVYNEKIPKEMEAAWAVPYGIDYRSIRQEAVKDAVYDFVKDFITDAALIRQFNLKSVTKNRLLNHKLPFILHTTRKCQIHAFMFYFSTSFGHCQQQKCKCKCAFTNRPGASENHQRPNTLFYLPEPLPVEKGDILVGTLQVSVTDKMSWMLKADITIELTNFGPALPPYVFRVTDIETP